MFFGTFEIRERSSGTKGRNKRGQVYFLDIVTQRGQTLII